MTFKELYKADIFRYANCADLYNKKFHYCFRKLQTCKNPLIKLWYRVAFSIIKSKRGIEIFYMTNIGKGLYLGHAYNITINSKAVIGSNCNIHKGVTIGRENRGKRKGTPTIGDRVWIGINATVVGDITVGDDVLIAPNSFVNCDVPSHSIVLGNPCMIKHRDNATEGYIDNCV